MRCRLRFPGAGAGTGAPSAIFTFQNAADSVWQCMKHAELYSPLTLPDAAVSVGAALTVPFARLPPDADLIAVMQAHGVAPLALSPAGTTPLAALPRPPRAGLILGAEGPGLPPDLLARAQSVSIPMAEGFDSLNVAVAAGLVLHHLAFAAGNPEP